MHYTRRKNRYRDRMLSNVAMLFGLLVIVFLLSVGCSAMVPESKAIQAAEDVGYTNVEVVDRQWFLIQMKGCSEDHNVRFTVRGTDPHGNTREIHVCAGVFTGGSIRS